MANQPEQFADQFVGEIRAVAFPYAPEGWALCNGQLLPLEQNTALFSLLGTTYGGDGSHNFALPNLQGRTPVGQGHGPGLSDRLIGDAGGVAQVGLASTEMPSHGHPARGVASAGNQAGPTDTLRAEVTTDSYAPAANGEMSSSAVGPTGGSRPHNNLPPYAPLYFIIALSGIFPPRP
jgi:microcystin-dependent protein